MRQLAAEDVMHNRARLITASFLTRNLGLDWRHGYRRFGRLLAGGDVADNAGNWQRVAGTGNNTRPNRVMNPPCQAHPSGPAGDYERRYVPGWPACPRPTSTPLAAGPRRPPPARLPLPLIDPGRTRPRLTGCTP